MSYSSYIVAASLCVVVVILFMQVLFSLKQASSGRMIHVFSAMNRPGVHSVVALFVEAGPISLICAFGGSRKLASAARGWRAAGRHIGLNRISIDGIMRI